jgi:hypothetical protein
MNFPINLSFPSPARTCQWLPREMSADSYSFIWFCVTPIWVELPKHVGVYLCIMLLRPLILHEGHVIQKICFWSNGNVRRDGEITGFYFVYRGPTEHVLSILQYSDSMSNSVKIDKKTLKNVRDLNPLQTKSRPLYLKTQSVPRCKHFSPGL